MTVRQAHGQPDAAAIAADLTASERLELLALADDEWRTAPPLAASSMLLFGHGIPLIAILGDWAKRSRFGGKVARALQPEVAS